MNERRGFIKGTPVHTRGGTIPIDALRPGDLVLAAPENGAGAPDYRRVTATHVYPERAIRTINTYGPQSEAQYFLAATGDQRFWVEGKGWTRADELGRHTTLRGPDGAARGVDAQWPVYRTGRPGIGWVQTLTDVVGSYGSTFDYERYDLDPDAAAGGDLPPGILESAQPFLAVTVYAVEVEEHHTYFVGYDGLWVHDPGQSRSSALCNDSDP